MYLTFPSFVGEALLKVWPLEGVNEVVVREYGIGPSEVPGDPSAAAEPATPTSEREAATRRAAAEARNFLNTGGGVLAERSRAGMAARGGFGRSGSSEGCWPAGVRQGVGVRGFRGDSGAPRPDRFTVSVPQKEDTTPVGG